MAKKTARPKRVLIKKNKPQARMPLPPRSKPPGEMPAPAARPNSFELADLTRLAVKFRDDRDWKQFHNPKDMALSMMLEVGEVIELMQWKNADALRQHLSARRGALADELSDVLYWVLTIAHDFNIDLAASFREKLEKSAVKYPIEKSRGRSDKYTEL